MAGFVQDFDQAQPGAHAGVVAAVQAYNERRIGNWGLRRREEIYTGMSSWLRLRRCARVLRAVAVEPAVGVSRVQSGFVRRLEEGFVFFLLFDFFHAFGGREEGVRVGGVDVDALAEFL